MKKYLIVLPLLVVAGCSSNTAYVATKGETANATGATTSPQTTTTQTEPVATAPRGETALSNDAPATGAAKGQPQVPPGMQMGSSMTLTPTPEMDAKIAAATKSGNKKALAQAYATRGTFKMNDPKTDAKIKYRAALADYRLALKFDPTNKEAQTSKALIESIYKSMGRPIPS